MNRIEREQDAMSNVIGLDGKRGALNSIGCTADVNAVISHYIDERAQACGEDDEYVPDAIGEGVRPRSR